MKEKAWLSQRDRKHSNQSQSKLTSQQSIESLGSGNLINKPNTLLEDRLTCTTPFDQLFSKQRSYIQSDEVMALQGIHLKPEQTVCESDFDITSVRNSKDQAQAKNPFNLNTIIGAMNLDSAKSNLSYSNVDLHQINALSTMDQQKNSKQRDEKVNMSSEQVSFNHQSSKELKDLQMSPYRSPIMRAKQWMPESEKIVEEHTEQGDFLKAMQGVGNIFRFLGIIQPKMKRFFYTKTMAGRIRGLTPTVRKTVNDLADYYLQDEKKNVVKVFFQYILDGLEKLYSLLQLHRIPIFNPENVVKIIFNCIIVSYNCFYLYLRSLEIFFDAEFGKANTYFHYIAEACWVIEMLVQMNTSMYHHNHFTKDRKVIMKIYLEEYFFFEILPLIFDGKSSENVYVSILFKLPLLLKTKGIMIILKKIEFYILQILDNHSVFFLLKLIIQMMLFGHILACAFSLVISYEMNFLTEETPWQIHTIEAEHSWVSRYLLTLYWAFKTMMNVNHEPPKSNIELAFQCGFMLISSVAFGYLISAIGNILSEISKEQKEYKKDLNILNQFMKRKKIEIGLVRRANIQLKKYYEQQRRVRYLEENETLLKLNEYMMKELLISSNLKVLKRYPFFFNLFTNSTLQKICTRMQERLYAPSQIIFDKSVEEQQDDYYLYLVVNGSITIEDQFNLNVKQDRKEDNHYRFLSLDQENIEHGAEEEDENSHDEKNLVGRRMKKGDYFGLKGFFTGDEVMSRAVSHDFSTVMVISKRETEKILEEEKKDFEKYMEIADKIKFSGNYNDLKTSCHSCSSRYHSTYSCPRVYYDKDPLYTISKQNFSFNQDRRPLMRVSEKTRNARSTANLMLRHALDFKMDYGLDQVSDLYSDPTFSEEGSLFEGGDQTPLNEHHFIREQTRTKTLHRDELKPFTEPKIFSEVVNIQGAPSVAVTGEDSKITNDFFRVESKFEPNNQFFESNLHMIPEDEGIYQESPVAFKGKGMPTSDNLIPFDHGSSGGGHFGGQFTSTIKSRGQQLSGQSQQPFHENNSYHGLNRPSAPSFGSSKQIQQDVVVRQLLEGMQHFITNLNGRGNTRRQSNVMSNLDISTKLAPQTSFYRKGSIEKSIRPMQNEDTGTKRSTLRNPLHQPSIVNSRGKTPTLMDTVIENSNQSKGQGQVPMMQMISGGQNADFMGTLRVFGDLDKMFNFDFYFPHHNSDEIIKRCNAIILKNNSKFFKSRKIKSAHGQMIRKSITLNTRNKDGRSHKTNYAPSKFQ